MSLISVFHPIGDAICEKYNLTPNAADCDAYDDSLDPRASTEYAHTAFRYFHTNIPSRFYFVNKSNKITRTITLEDAFQNNVTALLNKEYNNCLRGTLWQPIRNNKYGYVDDVCTI